MAKPQVRHIYTACTYGFVVCASINESENLVSVTISTASEWEAGALLYKHKVDVDYLRRLIDNMIEAENGDDEDALDREWTELLDYILDPERAIVYYNGYEWSGYDLEEFPGVEPMLLYDDGARKHWTTDVWELLRVADEAVALGWDADVAAAIALINSRRFEPTDQIDADTMVILDCGVTVLLRRGH